MTISDNLENLRKKIHTLALKYQRDPNTIKLLAACKSQSLEKIQEAIKAGQTCFGENYLQEALEKISALQNNNLEWHFIGNIQSNKTKHLAENFTWIQSVSNLKIATRLNDQRPANLPPLNICLEVNISHENTKSGLSTLEEITILAKHVLSLNKLKLRGVMAIPAIKPTLAEQRAECKKLLTLFKNLQSQGFNIDTLSMGMSGDLEAAIAEGSTMVRVGTDIFGNR